jgi:hypothetical protein
MRDLAGQEGADVCPIGVAAQQRKHQARRAQAVREHGDLLRAGRLPDEVDRGGPVVTCHVVERVAACVGRKVRTRAPVEEPDVEALRCKELREALRRGVGEVAERRHRGARREDERAARAAGHVMELQLGAVDRDQRQADRDGAGERPAHAEQRREGRDRNAPARKRDGHRDLGG